jgi:ASPIC/UnbV protein
VGLGKHERIDRLEVKWPLLGGETQRFKDILVERYIAIAEGEEKCHVHRYVQGLAKLACQPT